MSHKKRLTRSRSNRILGGVLGGIAEYFGWNATATRLIFVLLSFFPFLPGILVYIVACVIIPAEPYQDFRSGNRKDVTPDHDRP